MHNHFELTAVVLAKNEERCIERCLDSLTPEYVDNILVFDTGSSDSTVEKASAHRGNKIRVVTEVWANNFSTARNQAIEIVGTGWVLFVDADEYFEPGQAVKLRSMLNGLANTPHLQNTVVSPIIVDSAGFESAGVGRFLLANGNVRYFGAVHEEPRLKTDVAGEVQSVLSNIRLGHDGYDPDVVRLKNKASRNANLLRLCRESEPNNPRWQYEEFRAGLWTESRDYEILCCDNLAKLRSIHSGETARFKEVDMYYGLALRDLARRACAEGDMAWLADILPRLERVTTDSPDTAYFRYLKIVYPHIFNDYKFSHEILKPVTSLRSALDELIDIRQSLPDFQPEALHPSNANLDALICAYLEVLDMSSQAENYRQTIDGSWNESPFADNRFELVH